jgi:hypothetical protein
MTSPAADTADAPRAGLYLFCGCGQPTGIAARLTVHNT